MLDEEAEESKLFSANFNKKSKMFLSERWSSERTYDSTHYINFIKSRANCDPL